jgi:hypothetical protein
MHYKVHAAEARAIVKDGRSFKSAMGSLALATAMELGPHRELRE